MTVKTPIQKCLQIISEQRDLAKKADNYYMFLCFEHCNFILQQHLIDENHYFNENDVIFAIQAAYGHGRDESDDILHKQIEGSIKLILKCIKDKKIVKCIKDKKIVK